MACMAVDSINFPLIHNIFSFSPPIQRRPLLQRGHAERRGPETATFHYIPSPPHRTVVKGLYFLVIIHEIFLM